MIYKASHHRVIYPFLQLYSLWKIKINFHRVFVSGDFEEKGLPVLLISNHISWWDGFWVVYLNIKLFHRKFYFMMLEEELRNVCTSTNQEAIQSERGQEASENRSITRLNF